MDSGSESGGNHESIEDMMNRLLRSSETRTIVNIREVVKEEIGEELKEFKTMIPRIEKLERQVDNVQKSISRIEAAERLMNIVVHRFTERRGENHFDRDKIVQDLARNLGMDAIDYSETLRLGRIKIGRSRPILIKLIRYWDKQHIFSKARVLKGTSIFINDDLTPEERQKEGILRKKSRDLRNDNRHIKCSLLAQLDDYCLVRVNNKDGQIITRGIV